MLRLAGILTGSALAIVLIVMTTGTPRITVTPGAPDEPLLATRLESPAESPAREFADALAIVATGTDTTLDESGNTQPDSPQRPTPEPPSAETTEAEPKPESRPPHMEAANWYAFWSPFRSEIAADGFVARLQQTTGLDFRVVKLEPGVYEVAFAYRDDDDRAQKMQRITAATGLDLSGG